jgi:hypothetical protein
MCDVQWLADLVRAGWDSKVHSNVTRNEQAFAAAWKTMGRLFNANAAC